MKRKETCKVCKKEFLVYQSRKPVTYCSVDCKRSDYKFWHPILNKKYVFAKKERIRKVRFKWSLATEEQKVDRLRIFYEKHVVKNEGCWGWNGKIHGGGYAVMVWGDDHKQIGAHRVSYMIYKGTIADGLIVCHSCDNKVCTNPEHLFLGTYKDNTQDMLKKGRANRLKGEENPSSKLKHNDVIQIKKMLECGVLVANISSIYGISVQSIYDIMHKRTWKHVL